MPLSIANATQTASTYLQSIDNPILLIAAVGRKTVKGILEEKS